MNELGLDLDGVRQELKLPKDDDGLLDPGIKYRIGIYY